MGIRVTETEYRKIEYRTPLRWDSLVKKNVKPVLCQRGVTLPLNYTSKCMHGMNQTEDEYPRHSKRSQTASLSQISPVPSIGDITRYLLHMRRICHLT